MKQEEKVIVIDFGNPQSQNLTRTLRELGVYSELYPNTTTAREIEKNNPIGLIFAGHLHDSKIDYTIDSEIFNLRLPILALNSGMKVVFDHFTKSTYHAKKNEIEDKIIKQKETDLLNRINYDQSFSFSEHIQFTKLDESFEVVAKTNDLKSVVAFQSEANNIYGLNYYPNEQNEKEYDQVLENFLYKICKAKGKWSVERFIDLQIKKIQQTVGSRNVLCGLSGGVDSSVVAALIHKAIGKQLTCIFVDHGLLRKNEGEDVMNLLGGQFEMNIIKVDAKNRFLQKLKGISDPEEKRKIIGNEFINVFDDEATKLENVDFLAQGTLYSDVIESGGQSGKTIKSHHNVGGLPEDMKLDLIEPLNKLFKDEVRKVGEALGLPSSLVWRQPFPGPGLGIRIIGEVTEEKLEIVRESDAILREVIFEEGLEKDIWQYFTVLPNIRSVGVRDDARTYDHTIGIRAVTSVDGMTSNWARIPYDVLDKISQRIVNEVKQVNRVVYDITSKPPSTIEWE